ncbi:MAG TPA: hypothetical protein VMW64_04325 [Dehalococcoidia bacterium]|nr:hypothetical protein [Dehalococcoidia bacterium]
MIPDIAMGSKVCDKYTGSCGRVLSTINDEVTLEPIIIKRGARGEYLEVTLPPIRAKKANLGPDHIRRYEELPSDHELLLHFGVEELASPGVVLDEARARATPCSCFTYKGKDLCWSKGIVGMLAADQQDIYCVAGKMYKAQPALTKRYETFAEAAEEAHKKIEAIPRGTERLEVWLSAMGAELTKRGIEV